MKSESEIREQALLILKERLKDYLHWYPYPAFISFGLALVLTTFFLPSLNPRLGQPARLTSYEVEPEKEGAIWFSMSYDAIAKDIIVTTATRQVFRWPARLDSLEPLEPFKQYLIERVKHKIESAALSREARATDFLAVIATDRSLRYIHLRPVINILAEVGLARYALESLRVVSSKSQDSQRDHAHL